MQEFVLKKILNKKRLQIGRVGKAEVKILIVIIYFSVFSILGIAAFAYVSQNVTYQRSIFAYIFCESSGFSPIDCFEEILDTRTREILGVILSTSTISFALWPVVVLIFVADFKAIYMKMPKLSRASTTSTGVSGPTPRPSVTSDQGPGASVMSDHTSRPSVSSIGDQP